MTSHIISTNIFGVAVENLIIKTSINQLSTRDKYTQWSRSHQKVAATLDTAVNETPASVKWDVLKAQSTQVANFR